MRLVASSFRQILRSVFLCWQLDGCVVVSPRDLCTIIFRSYLFSYKVVPQLIDDLLVGVWFA